MGERIYHGAHSCSGTNFRKCQDLGDSILLILGTFILLNVGINVVTLLWKHLKSSLRILFRHYFPRGFLPGHGNHLDSWIPDTNDETISRCCWMPPQCGHGRAPTEAPWELWKEGLMGAGKVSQAPAMKTQASSFARPEISSQIPKISKLNMAPPSSSQDNKIKAPVESPPRAPAQAPTYTSTNTHEHSSTQSQTQTSEHSELRAQDVKHTSAHTPPSRAPDFIPGLSEVPKPAKAPSPTSPHQPAPNPPYPPIKAPTHSQSHALVVATFGSSFSTGHMVYDARRAKPSAFPRHDVQDSRYIRKDLNTLSRSQEMTGLVNSGTVEQTPKQHGGDNAEPPSRPRLGYLELGNMEWKISDHAKDKFSQPKTFPYSSVHPCCSERKTEEAQAPLYHQFLVYAQDATPSKPCLHSPSTTQSTLTTAPTPCTLSLPLISPRTFAVSQSNHLKPSSLTQAPSFLSTPNSPPMAASSHFSIPPHFSTISQSFIQPPNPENQNLNQGLDLQKTPSLAKDSGVLKDTGFTQDTGLRKNPSLTPNPGFQKNPGLTQDSSLHKNPGLTLTPDINKNLDFYKFPNHTQDLYLCMNPNSSQDSCLQKNLDISQESGLRSPAAIQDAGVLRSHSALDAIQHPSLHKNGVFNETSGQSTLSFMQDSLVYRNAPLNQDPVINKNKDPSLGTTYKGPDPSGDSGGNNATGNVQHPVVCRNVGFTQDSRSQKNRCHTEDSEVNKISGLTQESSTHKSLGLVQTSCLHKSSGLTQDSGDYKNLGLIQDSQVCRVPDLIQDSDSYRSSSLINGTETEKRSDLNRDVSFYSSEHSQNSNLQGCSTTERGPCPHQDPALGRGSGFKPPGLTQQAIPCKDSGLILDAGLTKRLSYVPGTDSAQISGSLQTVMLTPSPVKPFSCKMASHKDNTKQHLPRTSVPFNQNSCPHKAQVISTDLKTFSEVPVLIELQQPSRPLDRQDWVYHPVDTVPPACQKYRQMSMPPKINWKPHCLGPGLRSGHVVFDSHQKPLVTGREKCEALCSRRFRQEAPRNSRRPRRSGDIKM
ncbi:LOW QUALITY PROTEIN: uncharacterized protein SPEM3 [Mus pahari]|uniref:LOW QUALITY PROTEIN: uncharacterized protein SPEM3 n=1 Tax=Mus pahari TaxID=10093 RepID=UPI0011149602|nr:LOW QUALITY PROTEIN: uncharacterized protein SPEM3 [Mus pahari]